MKRLLVLAALIAAATVALTLAGGAGASGARSAATTVRVVERATTDAVTDTGKKGDSAGDILTFANDVYDSANANKVGSDQGFCIRTVKGKAWECWWTLFLAKGQITVQGPFFDAGPSALAITGGTGAYKNARGWMDLKARNDAGTEYDFIYHLT